MAHLWFWQQVWACLMCLSSCLSPLSVIKLVRCQVFWQSDDNVICGFSECWDGWFMSRNATVQFGFYYVCELYDAAAVYGVFFWWVLVFFFCLIFVISSVFMHYVLRVLSEWLFLGSPWKSWSLLWIVPAVIFLYSNIIVLDMKCSWMEKPANCQLCACHQFCTVSSFLIQCVNWGLMSVIVKNDVRMLCDLLIFCLFQLCFWVLKPIPGYH